MAVNKNYCMSSFLALRYIYDDQIDFANGLKHRLYTLHKDEEKTYVRSVSDIDDALNAVFSTLEKKKKGILLSGGMDSAILASYLNGCDAYTFRFLDGTYQKDELARAELFAKVNNLKLHYVDISWKTVEDSVDLLMRSKNAPVHSIEPQLYAGAIQAKKDGIDTLIIGDAADYVFYGMDGLLSKDWLFEDFYNRFIYIEPSRVLKESTDLHYIFEKYRIGDHIDFLGMYDTITTIESYASYENAFHVAGINYVDPYELLKMANSVDLNRIRSGDSKYLIRSLFKYKYPSIPIPEKNPMPRPVDFYFKDWDGPKRKEFREDLDVSSFSGNQKWMIWVLERFLNIIENESI